MQVDTFIEQSRPFITWMLAWRAGLKPISLASLAVQQNPRSIGIISVDVIEGFCSVGPLASPRVNRIVEPIATLFKAAWAFGTRDILLTQDTHEPNAVEFAQYAPHCVRNTIESESVAAFRSLDFYSDITVLPKNSINSGLAPGFREWIAARQSVKTWIVVGDCTDLCTHQLAMHMRTWANQNQLGDVRIVLPVNCVDTYDLPVQTATDLGIVPHDGAFLDLVFLYNMMQNGIEVVSEISASN